MIPFFEYAGVASGNVTREDCVLWIAERGSNLRCRFHTSVCCTSKGILFDTDRAEAQLRRRSTALAAEVGGIVPDKDYGCLLKEVTNLG